MSIETELQELISTELLVDRNETSVGTDEPLVSSGRIDSLGLLKIVSFIQEKYEVDVMAIGEPEDFETIDSLASIIRRSQKSDQPL